MTKKIYVYHFYAIWDDGKFTGDGVLTINFKINDRESYRALKELIKDRCSLKSGIEKIIIKSLNLLDEYDERTA